MSEPQPKQRPNLEQQARKLRVSTCELLGLGSDFDKLSAADKVVVDRASVLRLQVDDARMAQLRGEKIDTDEFVRASEQLENVLRTDRRVSAMGTSSGLEEARAKLKQVLGVLEPDLDLDSDPDTPRPLSEVERLRQENLQLRQDLAERLSAPSSSAPAPAPNERDNVVAIDANSRRPPAHYLKDGRPPEPWRDSVEGRGAGAICAPYFNIENLTGKT